MCKNITQMLSSILDFLMRKTKSKQCFLHGYISNIYIIDIDTLELPISSCEALITTFDKDKWANKQAFWLLKSLSVLTVP